MPQCKLLAFSFSTEKKLVIWRGREEAKKFIFQLANPHSSRRKLYFTVFARKPQNLTWNKQAIGGLILKN